MESILLCIFTLLGTSQHFVDHNKEKAVYKPLQEPTLGSHRRLLVDEETTFWEDEDELFCAVSDIVQIDDSTEND